MKATIPTAALKAERIADTDSTRYALNGVLLCDGRAVATDGRGMVILQWRDEPSGKPVIVPASSCRAVFRVSKLTELRQRLKSKAKNIAKLVRVKVATVFSGAPELTCHGRRSQ